MAQQPPKPPAVTEINDRMKDLDQAESLAKRMQDAGFDFTQQLERIAKARQQLRGVKQVFHPNG